MYWDAIGDKSARVLKALGATKLADRFVLVGGTALALLFGHRISRDLDFFSAKPTAQLNSGHILRALRASGLPVRPVARESDQVRVTVDGVPVMFLAYPFRFVHKPWRDSGVLIADPRDVAIMKAYALGRRATARDYIDLAYLLEKGIVAMDEMVEQAKAVFRFGEVVEFSERLFIQQLTYTADLEDREEAVALLLEPGWDFERVQRILRQYATAWAEKTLEGKKGEP